MRSENTGIYPGRVMRENKWKKTPYPQLTKYCKTLNMFTWCGTAHICKNICTQCG